VKAAANSPQHGGYQSAATLGQPAIQATYSLLPGRMNVMSRFDANGSGWLGARFNGSLGSGELQHVDGGGRISGERDGDDYGDDHGDDAGLSMQCGGWINFDKLGRRPSNPRTVPFQAQSANLYAAAEFRRTLLAAEASMPIPDENKRNQWIMPSVDTMLSIDVNDDKTSPLWVTVLARNHGTDRLSWTMNVNQTVTFDRYIVNIMEERAPKVRQSLSWSIQMDTSANAAGREGTVASNNDPAIGPQMNNHNHVQIGAAWQLNRALALKGVAHDDGRVDTSIMLKRWEQPAVTFSLLNSFQLNKLGSKPHSFFGFALEVEASPGFVSGTPDAEYSGPTTTFANHPTPKTKIHLPPEVENSSNRRGKPTR